MAPVILHIIDELKVGGAQTHLVTMLRQLVGRDGLQHHVLSLFGDGDVGDELRGLEVEVTVIDLRPYLARKRFDLAAAQIKQQIVRLQPAIVEAHLTWSRLLGLFAASRVGIPKRFGFEQGDIYLSSLPFRLLNFASQWYIEQIIVCSHALKHWVQSTHHISASKLTVFHNCVDTDRFRPDVHPTADMPIRPPGTTRFAIVGSLGEGVNKRVDIAITALAEARRAGRDVELMVVGDGSQRPALTALAARLDAGEHIHFLGIRTDIPAILTACDALCHAAPFEPFGIVAIEAMAAGLPVIVPNSGGIVEAVTRDEDGLVYPALNAPALAQQMIALHDNPERRTAMGKRARKHAIAEFSAAVYVKRLYHLYGIDV